MATPPPGRRHLNLWTLIAVAVFAFGVAMIARAAIHGADAIIWALFVAITLASAIIAAWLVALHTPLS